MRKTDLPAGLALFAAGMVTLLGVIPAQIGGRSDYGLAPDFFPRLLIWLFTALTGLLIAHRLLARRVHHGRPHADGDAETPMAAGDWGFIGAAAVFLAILFVTMKHAGFVPAGVIAVATTAALMGGLKAGLLRFVLLSAAAPLAVFYVFKHLFQVFLPS